MIIKSKVYIENYLFSQLDSYYRKNLTIYKEWQQDLKSLYQTFHELDAEGGYRYFSVLSENLVDQFRLEQRAETKRDRLLLLPLKLQPVIGSIYQVISIQKQSRKLDSKDYICLGYVFAVTETGLVSNDGKMILCESADKIKDTTENLVIDKKRNKRLLELLPGLFCFHTKDDSKQALIFT